MKPNIDVPPILFCTMICMVENSALQMEIIIPLVTQAGVLPEETLKKVSIVHIIKNRGNVKHSK
jgi:hypothetical protein